jgi:hypothetical protein
MTSGLFCTFEIKLLGIRIIKLFFCGGIFLKKNNGFNKQGAAEQGKDVDAVTGPDDPPNNASCPGRQSTSDSPTGLRLLPQKGILK